MKEIMFPLIDTAWGKANMYLVAFLCMEAIRLAKKSGVSERNLSRLFHFDLKN